MYDMHAHVLPGVDHGCEDIDMAVAQLRFLSSVGVTHVAATSHFYPDRENVHAYLERRRRAENELKVWRSSHPDCRVPAIYAGAEVLVTEGLHRMKDIDKLCIEGTDTLLLEMPFFKWSVALFDTMEQLCRLGLHIVLAHVNRYPVADVNRIFDMGAYGQLNLEALGRFRLLSFALSKMLDDGRVVTLGSDLHGPGDQKTRSRFARAEKLPERHLMRMAAISEDIFREAIPVFA